MLFLLSLLSPSAQAAKPNCPANNGCSSVNSVILWMIVTYWMCKSVEAGSEAYSKPSIDLLEDWKHAVRGMLKDTCSTSKFPQSLQEFHHKLEPFTGCDCVLASFALDVSGTFLAHPHGAVIVNTGDDVKALSVDIPHSSHDDHYEPTGNCNLQGNQWQ